uniref:Hypoxia inducible lipid droplet associated n=4 Tax=Felidae TaxID=9681 RepID=A0ABI7WZ30_FELCA
MRGLRGWDVAISGRCGRPPRVACGGLRFCARTIFLVAIQLCPGADFLDSCTTRCYRKWTASGPSSWSIQRPSRSGRKLSCSAEECGVLSAMKPLLNLYLLGVVLTLLSIFVRLMESLGGLLESPLPGSSWTTRSQPASTEPPRAFQTIHPEGCDKTSLHRL